MDTEIGEALDLLSLNSPTAPKALVDFLKGSIAGRPNIFDEETVPQWLATDKAPGALRAVDYAYMDGEPVQPFADKAAEFFAAFEGAAASREVYDEDPSEGGASTDQCSLKARQLKRSKL